MERHSHTLRHSQRFTLYFPSSRNDILLGSGMPGCFERTEMTTSGLLGEGVVRTIASHVAAAAAAALGRPREALAYFGAPFDGSEGAIDAFLVAGLWPKKVSEGHEYCSWKAEDDGHAELTNVANGPPHAERGVLSPLLVEKLGRHFKRADCDHLDGYSGDLRSYYVEMSDARHSRMKNAVHAAGMAIFERLPDALRREIGGFEWWVHRRPWQDNWTVGSLVLEQETVAPKVIPGMRLHLDGDHTRSVGSLYTSLLFLGDPVGSPTVVVKSDADRRTYSAKVRWDGFHGGAYHGALPSGTFDAGTHRVVIASRGGERPSGAWRQGGLQELEQWEAFFRAMGWLGGRAHASRGGDLHAAVLVIREERPNMSHEVIEPLLGGPIFGFMAIQVLNSTNILFTAPRASKLYYQLERCLVWQEEQRDRPPQHSAARREAHGRRAPGAGPGGLLFMETPPAAGKARKMADWEPGYWATCVLGLAFGVLVLPTAQTRPSRHGARTRPRLGVQPGRSPN